MSGGWYFIHFKLTEIVKEDFTVKALCLSMPFLGKKNQHASVDNNNGLIKVTKHVRTSPF